MRVNPGNSNRNRHAQIIGVKFLIDFCRVADFYTPVKFYSFKIICLRSVIHINLTHLFIAMRNMTVAEVATFP